MSASHASASGASLADISNVPRPAKTYASGIRVERDSDLTSPYETSHTLETGSYYARSIEIPEDQYDASEPLPSSHMATPDPLIAPKSYFPQDSRAYASALGQTLEVPETAGGGGLEEPFPDITMELSRVTSQQQQQQQQQAARDHPAGSDGGGGDAVTTTPPGRQAQGVPPELKNLAAEVVFVLVCTAGQVIFALSLGQMTVVQTPFRDALGITPTQVPWLVGSSLLAQGLSVIIAGSFADLASPKPLMVGAFLWEVLWNVVAGRCLTPNLAVLFFVCRAMQGLAVGILVSASMSILGRVYNPGQRKTRVFSIMAGGSPLGFWFGCLQGGALTGHLSWIFDSTAILLGLCALAAWFTVPPLGPAKDSERDAGAPSLKQFDYWGALLAATGCGLVLFGLTQGSSVNWNPYSYSLIIVGLLCFVGFYFVEQRVARPLIPNGLWRTPGFAALLISYFFGFGGFNGAWQFYAIQFWQRYQDVSPLTTALYFIPNAIVGVLAVWVVAKTLHRVPGHIIFATSMVAFGIGPAFFLPQKPGTSYWALSMPGVALTTLGPDLSFAAAAIFITSSVPRSYQGSAGSLLVTVQNLASAIMTSVADSIGVKVDKLPSGEIGLEGLRAIWWLSLGSALFGALLTCLFVRIPKAEEKEHVQ